MAGDTVSDVLQTRLEMAGLGEYTSGWLRAGNAVGVFEGKLNSAAKSQLAWSLGLGAVSLGGLHFFIDAAKDAGEEAADFQRAVGNFKGTFPLEDMRAFTESLSDLTGIEDQAIVQSLGLLGTFQLTAAQAKQLEPAILNAAESLRAMGVSSEGLANAVGKAIESGNVQGLKRMGVIIHDTAFESKTLSQRVTEVADALQHQGGDAAAAFAKSLPGQFRRLSTDLHELKEDLGEALIGPLGRVVSGADGLIHTLRGLSPEVKQAAAVTGVVLAGAAGIASLALLGLTVQTGMLAREELLAAKAARAEAAELDGVAAAVTRAAGAKAAAGGAGAGAAGAAAKGGKGSGMLKRGAGAAGLVAATLGLDFIPDDSLGGFGKKIKHTGSNVLGGAAIGELFGGVPGAIVGGTLGLLKSAVEDTVDLFGSKKGTAAKSDPHLTEAQKQTEELRKQTELLDRLAKGELVDTKGTLSGSMMVGAAMARARALQH